MASGIALRRKIPPISTIFSNLKRSPSILASFSRSLNTPTHVTIYGGDNHGTSSSSSSSSSSSDSDSEVDVRRSPKRSVLHRLDRFPRLFSDAFDPFSPTRSLSQVLNPMDQLIEDPLLASRGFGARSRRGWDLREEDDALYLRIDMPGLSKDDVKVAVYQNTLTIRGEGGKEEGDKESGRKYSSRIDLPRSMYKFDEIKAEMKNGILKLMVPKVKEEDRKDVFQVQVE